jgi:hypothetical protein
MNPCEAALDCFRTTGVGAKHSTFAVPVFVVFFDLDWVQVAHRVGRGLLPHDEQNDEKTAVGICCSSGDGESAIRRGKETRMTNVLDPRAVEAVTGRRICGMTAEGKGQSVSGERIDAALEGWGLRLVSRSREKWLCTPLPSRRLFVTAHQACRVLHAASS